MRRAAPLLPFVLVVAWWCVFSAAPAPTRAADEEEPPVDYRFYKERISPAAGGGTLLTHLTRSYPHSAEEEWRRRIESGRVRVDSRVTTPSSIARANA